MKQKQNYLALLLFFILGCTGPQPKILEQSQKYPEELQQLHRNIINYYFEEIADSDDLQEIYSTLSDEGTWPDIDYPSKTRGAWSPRIHLSRLLDLVIVYQKPGTDFYQKSEVSKRLHLALNYWLDNDFTSPNWWHPVIGTPMLLNPILILMEPELTKIQIQKAMPILNRCKIGRTGQNKVWQSGNVLLTSMLSRNSEMIKKAAASIQEELVMSTEEGVQPDWSYHQHGPQLQFGNYGLSYVGDMQKWIQILRKTPFRFDEDKVEILRNYLLKGQQWVTWKNEMDISACGRQIGPDEPQKKAERLASFYRKMEKLDPEFASEYQKANDYKNLVGNKHFWRSDIQIQRCPEYYFSVKMSSNRVIGAESCNSENLQGYYLGDGASYLYQTGKEYKNIFPFWDWKKIPGTTTLQDANPLPVLTWKGYRIPSDFVGGVSDGQNGIAVLDYNRLGLSARKSWFMFDDKIICLGAGIHSEENLPVTTSVNQTFLAGKVESKMNSGYYQWILHDHLGYYFPEPLKMVLKTNAVKGKWTDVTILLSDDEMEAKLFNLYFDHGVNPENASYQYILIPQATQSVLEEMETKFPFRIKNDKNFQLVETFDNKLTGVVFYEPGTADIFGGITSEQPCVLMLKSQENGIQLSVADPTQKLSELNLVLNGNYSGKNTKVQDGKTVVNIQLPQNEFAGQSVTLKLLISENK